MRSKPIPYALLAMGVAWASSLASAMSFMPEGPVKQVEKIQPKDIIHSAKNNGGAEGGAGDPLTNHFIKARRLAIRSVLAKTNPLWIDPLEKKVQAFYTEENRQKMIWELEHSDMIVRSSNPNGKCGETQLNSKATIWISKKHCGNIWSQPIRLATEMIIGEAAHHLKANDTLAGLVGTEVYATYMRGTPLWGKWILQDSNEYISYMNIRTDPTYLRVESDLEYDYRRMTKPAGVSFDRARWDRFKGTFELEGDFKVRNSRGRVCYFPVVAAAKASQDGKRLWVTFASPRTLYYDTCKSTGSNKHSYVFIRRRKTIKDKFPWAWIFKGELPQAATSSLGPFNYIFFGKY